MHAPRLVVTIAAALGTGWPSQPANPQQADESPTAVERRVPVGNASLYARAIGRGRPIIVLHGGPDFDHR
jgi:proline iminopeptidase